MFSTRKLHSLTSWLKPQRRPGRKSTLQVRYRLYLEPLEYRVVPQGTQLKFTLEPLASFAAGATFSEVDVSVGCCVKTT